MVASIFAVWIGGRYGITSTVVPSIRLVEQAAMNGSTASGSLNSLP